MPLWLGGTLAATLVTLAVLGLVLRRSPKQRLLLVGLTIQGAALWFMVTASWRGEPMGLTAVLLIALCVPIVALLAACPSDALFPRDDSPATDGGEGHP